MTDLGRSNVWLDAILTGRLSAAGLAHFFIRKFSETLPFTDLPQAKSPRRLHGPLAGTAIPSVNQGGWRPSLMDYQVSRRDWCKIPDWHMNTGVFGQEYAGTAVNSVIEFLLATATHHPSTQKETRVLEQYHAHGDQWNYPYPAGYEKTKAANTAVTTATMATLLMSSDFYDKTWTSKNPHIKPGTDWHEAVWNIVRLIRQAWVAVETWGGPYSWLAARLPILTASPESLLKSPENYSNSGNVYGMLSEAASQAGFNQNRMLLRITGYWDALPGFKSSKEEDRANWLGSVKKLAGLMEQYSTPQRILLRHCLDEEYNRERDEPAPYLPIVEFIINQRMFSATSPRLLLELVGEKPQAPMPCDAVAKKDKGNVNMFGDIFGMPVVGWGKDLQDDDSHWD